MPTPAHTVAEYAQHYLPLDADGKVRDARIRERIVDHLMRKRAIELTERRAFEEGIAGTLDMRMINIFKYLGTEDQKQKADIIVDILGMTGARWQPGVDPADTIRFDLQRATSEWMSSMSYTIAGGSSEVQLNLIAKRSLDLPEA